MNKLLILYCMVLFCFPRSGITQDVTQLLDLPIEDLLEIKILTIATGKQQSQLEAPAITTVITAADIEAIGAMDLDEILASVPGLHVSRTASFNNPIYVVRGLYSTDNPEILLLVNGVPIKQLHAGNRGNMWGGMPVNSIARIEIIRGPGSAVHGADAFAGVINIITKTRAEISGTEVGARIGSFNSKEAWLLHGNNYHGLDVAAMLELNYTDGHNAIIEQDLQSYFDQFIPEPISLAPDEINNQRKNLDARFDIDYKRWNMQLDYQRRNRIGTGVGIAESLDPHGAYQTDRYGSNISYHNPQVSRYWDLMGSLYVNEHRVKSDPEVNLFPGQILRTKKNERHAGINFIGFYSGFNKHLIRIGTGMSYGELHHVTHQQNFGIDPHTNTEVDGWFVDYTGTEYAFVPQGNRLNIHWFIQDEWQLHPQWTLTAGLRFDNYSDFRETWNPRLALVWQATEEFSAKLLYGEAFRAPSFAELHNVVEELRPEKIRSYELSLIYKMQHNLRTTANLYRFKLDDNINYTALQPDTTAVNIGQLTGHGLELEIFWRAARNLAFLGNYAQQRVGDEHDYRLANAPREQTYVRADWQFIRHWYLNAQLNIIGKREREVFDPRAALGGYSSVDLTLRRKGVAKYWDVAFSVRNLLNADRREPSLVRADGIIGIPHDLPLAKRSVFLETRYRF